MSDSQRIAEIEKLLAAATPDSLNPLDTTDVRARAILRDAAPGHLRWLLDELRWTREVLQALVESDTCGCNKGQYIIRQLREQARRVLEEDSHD